MNIRTLTRTLLLSTFAFLWSLQAAQAVPLIGGQTFDAPGTATFLESINTGNIFGGSNSSFELYAYSGTDFTGPSLFSQAISGSTNGLTLSIGLLLNPLSSYVFLLRSDSIGFSANGTHIVPGNFVQCFDGAQACNNFSGDLNGFATNYSVSVSVPEPSTYLLMLTGILGLAFVAGRRRGEGLA